MLYLLNFFLYLFQIKGSFCLFFFWSNGVDSLAQCGIFFFKKVLLIKSKFRKFEVKKFLIFFFGFFFWIFWKKKNGLPPYVFSISTKKVPVRHPPRPHVFAKFFIPPVVPLEYFRYQWIIFDTIIIILDTRLKYTPFFKS